MNDLSSVDWSTSKQTIGTESQYPRKNPISSYPSLQPTPPISGRSSPLPPQYSNKPSSAAAPIKVVPHSNDSFANLLPFNASQSDKILSLQEQQKALQEKKRAEQERSQKQGHGLSLGSQDGKFWDSLSSATTAQKTIAAPPSYAGTDEYGGPKLSKAINKPFAGVEKASLGSRRGAARNGSVDLLLDFEAPLPDNTLVKSERLFLPTDMHSNHIIKSNSSAKIPSPLSDLPTNDRVYNAVDKEASVSSIVRNLPPGRAYNDSSPADEEDILGLLGRPMSEFSKANEKEKSTPERSKAGSPDPTDRALAELIDMGFSVGKSQEALQSTESSRNVQEAVGWLLNQAHADSRKTSELNRHELDSGSRQRPSEVRSSSGGRQIPSNDSSLPVWMREKKRSHSGNRRDDSRSPVYGESDPGKYAAELGNNIFKTANSLWKSGTQKITKAVSELNSDSDSNQPKWMREAHDGARTRKTGPAERENGIDRNVEKSFGDLQQPLKDDGSSVTDEALLLEARDTRRPSRRPFRPDDNELLTRPSESARAHSPVLPQNRNRRREIPAPQLGAQPFKDLKTTLSRQSTEEQSSNIYMSPARRKRPLKPLSPEPELLFDTSQSTSRLGPSIPHTKTSTLAAVYTPTQAATVARVKSQARVPPTISPSVLQTSTRNRQEGTAAFKRGDYALATRHYSAALSALPPTHPVAIILFTNRALTHLKTGDAKLSIADAQSALALIGPSQGAFEQIDLGTEGTKEMKTFWAKAMARQAEGLEQLERWSDAASAWKSCIEAGEGDAVSIAGRDRCEKAAAGPSSQAARPPKPKPKPPKPKAVPKTSALDELAGHPAPGSSTDSNAFSGEAVQRLREANLEAERVDDEKFALSDQVSDRLARWRAGKESNIRALLASLDTVLWDGVGWKKVGMGELIVPAKVKVVYMKGIAKVHPDKVGTYTISLLFLSPSPSLSLKTHPPHTKPNLPPSFSPSIPNYLQKPNPATKIPDPPHSNNRTAHDQRLGLRGLERSLGWIQAHKRPLRNFTYPYFNLLIVIFDIEFFYSFFILFLSFFGREDREGEDGEGERG